MPRLEPAVNHDESVPAPEEMTFWLDGPRKLVETNIGIDMVANQIIFNSFRCQKYKERTDLRAARDANTDPLE